jgi:hypothetical protein
MNTFVQSNPFTGYSQQDVEDSPETDTKNVTEMPLLQPVALPTTVKAMMDQRTSKTRINLNDQVDQIHCKLYEEEEYRNYLDAVYNSQALTGSTIYDDGEAGRMILDYAKSNGYPYVAQQNLTTVVKALRVVMRRYHISRKERRQP